MKAGIYKIYNKVSNKSYIGSSENLKRRIKDHKIYLRNNTHPSTHLQNSYNKYGILSFEYSIIEYCSIDELEKREQYWLDTVPICSRYNQRGIVKSNRGMKWNENSKKKLIGRTPWNKGIKTIMPFGVPIKKGQRLSPTTEFKKGQHTWNNGLKGVCKPNKSSFKPTKFFQVVSPSNILYEGINLYRFCLEMNIGYDSIRRLVFDRNRKEYNGWRLPSLADNYEGIGLWINKT